MKNAKPKKSLALLSQSEASAAALYELFGVVAKARGEYVAYVFKKIKKKNVEKWHVFEKDGFKAVKGEDVLASKNVKILLYRKF
jgi:hypothetical protein